MSHAPNRNQRSPFPFSRLLNTAGNLVQYSIGAMLPPTSREPHGIAGESTNEDIQVYRRDGTGRRAGGHRQSVESPHSPAAEHDSFDRGYSQRRFCFSPIMTDQPQSNVTSNSMKIQFHIRGVKDDLRLRRRLQRSLEGLAARIPISDAAVVVEHEPHSGPTFRAFSLLAVPGPDIHAEAHDYTFDAAWLKVTTALFKQIEQRKSQQVLRTRRNGHVRTQSRRRIAKALNKC